jgi:transmembrane sensor
MTSTGLKRRKQRTAAEKLEALDREAYDWLVRFAAGGAQPADLAALQQWAARSPAHAAAFDRASRLWQAAGPAGQELALETASSDRAAIALARTRLRRRAFLGGGALAAAAAAAALMVAHPPLGLWPSWPELDADYRTGAGVQRRIALSDRVSIELNTRSSIALHSTGARVDGIELIAGEAAIAVVPGKAFTVTAGNGRTTSGGDARFNVRFQDQTVCVTCIAGNIEVEQGSALVPLSAGRQVRYSARGMKAAVPIDPAVVTAWQEGVVIFQSTPVAEVVAEVNRYRPGRVILTNAALGRRLFNARLRISDIDRVIGQIAELFGARETVLPGGIVLLG